MTENRELGTGNWETEAARCTQLEAASSCGLLRGGKEQQLVARSRSPRPSAAQLAAACS